jgi:hypothetical protein
MLHEFSALSLKNDLLLKMQDQDVYFDLPSSAINLVLSLLDCGTASFVMPNFCDGNQNRLKKLMVAVRSKCQGLRQFKAINLAQGKVRFLKQMIVRTLPHLANLQVVQLPTVHCSNSDLQLIAEKLPCLVYVFF